MKIPLTHGKFAIVGPRDYTYLMQWKWMCSDKGYAIRRAYLTPTESVQIAMHRLILERMGYKNFVQTDHKNRNRLDNCRSNLRPATVRQNQQNHKRRSDNTSGYMGVGWHRGQWRARITVNGKLIDLGYFDNVKEAAKVRNAAALKYHGDFATLNEV